MEIYLWKYSTVFSLHLPSEKCTYMCIKQYVMQNTLLIEIILWVLNSTNKNK